MKTARSRVAAAALAASAALAAPLAGAQVVSDCRPVTSGVPEPGAWTIGAKHFATLWATYERIATTADFWPTLVLCESLQPNAAAMTAGRKYAVVMFTGLVRLTGGDADELAAVLSHEFGHLLHGHAERKLRVHNAARRRAIQEAQSSVRAGSDEGDAVMGAVHGYKKSVTAFSRDMEKEADDEGFSLARKAGFNASGLRRLAEKMQSREGPRQPGGYLATHPGWGERVKDSARLETNEGYRERAARAFEARDAAGLRKVVDEWRRDIPDSGAAAFYDAMHAMMTRSGAVESKLDEAVGYFNGEGMSTIAQGYQAERSQASLALCVSLYRQGHKGRALDCLQLLESEDELRRFRELTGWNAFVFVPAAREDTSNLYVSRTAPGAVALTNCKRIATEANLAQARSWRVPAEPKSGAAPAPQMVCSPDLCNCEAASDEQKAAVSRASRPAP